MSITTIQQSTEVSDVGMVTVSDIVEDTENEVFVREIRAYSVPNTLGTRTLLFTLKVTADDESYIELNAPASTF